MKIIKCGFPYSLNGARFSTGVVPLDCLDCGSTDPFLGVCMPDGVEDPLRLRLCTKRKKKKQIFNILSQSFDKQITKLLKLNRKSKH